MHQGKISINGLTKYDTDMKAIFEPFRPYVYHLGAISAMKLLKDEKLLSLLQLGLNESKKNQKKNQKLVSEFSFRCQVWMDMLGPEGHSWAWLCDT